MAYTMSNSNYRRSSDADTNNAGGTNNGDRSLQTVKIVLVGDQSVGKSSLIKRYTRGEFAGENRQVATVGVEFFSKNVHIGGGHGEVRVQVWDTAGQEKHRSLTKQVFRGAKGVMLVYDVTSRSSFESLPLWVKEIKAEVHATCSFMLVGNKFDLVSNNGTAAGGGARSSESFGDNNNNMSSSNFGYNNSYSAVGPNSNNHNVGGSRYGSGRSVPPSPTSVSGSNANYYSPHGYGATPTNGTDNNGYYSQQKGGAVQGRDGTYQNSATAGVSPTNSNTRRNSSSAPPLPLSPSSNRNGGGGHHQRTGSAAAMQKYTYSSGGSGSTPTSTPVPSPANYGVGYSSGPYYYKNNSSVAATPTHETLDRTYNNGGGDRNSSGDGGPPPPNLLGETQRYAYTSGACGSTGSSSKPPTPSAGGSRYGGGQLDRSSSYGNYNNNQNSTAATYGRPPTAPTPSMYSSGMSAAARNLRSRQIGLKEADEFARSNGMSFLETSAKDTTNVERAFLWLVQNILETTSAMPPSPSTIGGNANGGGNNAMNRNVRGSVNLSGKDRPKGAGVGNFKKKKRKSSDSPLMDDDSDSDDGRRKGCPC